MNERVYNSGIERLRSTERVERLEVDRVVDLCLGELKINSVLDIGTGSGLFAEAFSKRGLIVAGVDSNPEMIEAAQAHLPSSEFKLSSAETLPFKDYSYEMVFMGLLLHEVDDFKKVLEEAARVSVKQVAILEWGYKIQEFGPPLEHRLKTEFVEQLSKDTGFSNFKMVQLTNLVLYILQK